MSKVGVFIVGTSPLPIYISIKNYLENSGEKIILLATEDNEFSKGTLIYAKRLKEAFLEEDIEIVLIDRSKLKVIGTEVDKIINSISNSDENIDVYLDFTGGTKLQSAFIRESFENNINTKKDNLTIVYVDGYEKTIKLKNKATSKDSEVCFDDIEGANDEDEIIKICKLHGYNVEIENDFVNITKDNSRFSCSFDEIYIKEYNLEFVSTLQNKLGKGNGGKGKVKLEIFKNIIHSEQIGGSFAGLELIVPQGEKDKYEKLRNEFLGIKKNIYKDRICFISN